MLRTGERSTRMYHVRVYNVRTQTILSFLLTGPWLDFWVVAI